jgi:hypothetical protein
MVGWKLLMRRVTVKGKSEGWESTLGPEEEKEFWALLRDMNRIRKIRSPRSITLKEGQFKRPILMVFGNGSREACCSLVYLRWDREYGHEECRLVIRKTRHKWL